MFVYEKNGVICGYYSLLMQDNNECELNNLAVLPEYRHELKIIVPVEGMGKGKYKFSV